MVLFQDGVMQPINDSGSACARPALVPHAYRMGGPVSSLSYNLPLPVLLSRSESSQHTWHIKWKSQQTHIHTRTHTRTHTHTHTDDDVSLIFIPRAHFSLDVRTESSEGLLFFAATKGGRSHLALYMSKGRIRLSAGKEKNIFNRENYDDGKWHSVSGLDHFVFQQRTKLITIS